MNAEKTFWPQTLKEFYAQAKIVDVSWPPYSVSRYASIDEAYRVGADTGETIYRDDWDLSGLPSTKD